MNSYAFKEITIFQYYNIFFRKMRSTNKNTNIKIVALQQLEFVTVKK